MAAPEPPKVTQIFGTTVLGDDGPLSTVFALLESGEIAYTGIAGEPRWHYLPPIPTREEAQKEEEGEDDEAEEQPPVTV